MDAGNVTVPAPPPHPGFEYSSIDLWLDYHNTIGYFIIIIFKGPKWLGVLPTYGVPLWMKEDKWP